LKKSLRLTHQSRFSLDRKSTVHPPDLNGAQSIKDYLLQNSTYFTRCLITKFLEYSAGREMSVGDQRIVDELVPPNLSQPIALKISWFPQRWARSFWLNKDGVFSADGKALKALHSIGFTT